MDANLTPPELPCAGCGVLVPVMFLTLRVHCGVCIHRSRGRLKNCKGCGKKIYKQDGNLCFNCTQADCTEVFAVES